MQSRPTAELSIILVDDERQTLKYFERAFARDFNVLTAASADEAEEIIDGNPGKIGVVISDQRMPGRNGVSLLNAVRRKHPSIVRMLTTAYSELDDAIDAVNRGEIFRYIVKPWDFDLLRQEINTGLLVYRLQAERDLLIGEKLHVRQRMLAVDRARDLAIIVAGLPKLRNAKHAVTDYVRDCAASPADLPSLSDTNVHDLWSMPQSEARHMGAVAAQAARVAEQLDGAGNGASSEDAVRAAVSETAADAATAKVSVSADVSTPAMLMASPELAKEMVSSALAAVIASTAEGGTVKISADGGSVNGAAGTTIRIATQQANGAAYTLLYGAAARAGKPDAGRLFAAYLAAREYGGAIKIERQGEKLSIDIAMPAHGQSVKLPDARPDWLDRLFQSFEAWPG